MAVKGNVREQSEGIVKKIGMVEVEVIAINPTIEEYESILGMPLKEGSNAAKYTGESKDGNPYVRVDFWLKHTKSSSKFKVSYFLEDKIRENKDATKKQFINDIGICSWGTDENNLPSWFAKRDYREAKSGEEDFYSFLRSWLGGLNYSEADTELMLEWKKVIKGNVEEIREMIGEKFSVPFIAMATVSIKEGEEEGSVVEYQGIYNKGFLPSYSMRQFVEKDFSDPNVISKIQEKESKDLKVHERFILNVIGEYGCKDVYSFSPLEEYVAEDHLVGSSESTGGDGIYEEEEPEY